MAQFQRRFVQDLTKPLIVRQCGDFGFNGDNLSDVISVDLYTDGVAYSGGGTCAGACICPDGSTVALSGAVSGKTASVSLTEDCFAIPGQIGIAIRITSGTTKTTVLKAIYNVEQFSTNNPVDPGSRIALDVGDLVNRIDAATADIPASDMASLMTGIAPTFSTSTAYPAGAYVYYNGTLYRFTAAHAAGSWTGTDAIAVALGNDLAVANSAVDYVESSLFNADKTPAEYQNGGISASGATNTNSNRVRSKGIIAFASNANYVVIDTGSLKVNLMEYSSQTTADTSTFVRTVTGGYVVGQIRFVPVSGYGYRLSIGNTSDTAIVYTDSALANISVTEVIPANAKDTEYDQRFDQLESDVAALESEDAAIDKRATALENTTADKLMFTSANMYDISTSQDGYTVRSDSGKVVEQSGYTASAFIPVKPNTTYSFFRRHVVAWYQADGTFISGVGSSDTSTTLTSPVNAALARFSHQTQYTYVQMSEGYIVPTAAADVVPYASHIDNNLIQNVIVSRNLYNIDTSLVGYSVRSDNGNLTAVTSKTASDYIPVKPNTPYSFNNRHTLAWYNESKEFISGVGSADTTVTFTSPTTAKYLRLSHDNNYVRVTCNEGTSVMPWQPYDMALLPELMGEASRYEMRYSTLTLPDGLANVGNLCLYGYKLIYSGTGSEKPKYQAFLFLDDRTNKFYIADTSLTTFTYAFDWDSSLAGGESVHSYMATITADGDVIFLRMWQRKNPIIYPHGDYSNPVVIDFGSSLKPYGFLTSISCTQFADGSFVFGEYAKHSLTDEQNNDPRNIWRVTKPYTTISNWTVAHRFKHVYFTSPVSDEPNNEIGHIHTVVYDFYSGRLICSTGDIDRHCRIWKSDDKGATWSELVSNGQKWRSLGMVFMSDCVYWATDSFQSNHVLYKANRVSGQINFSTAERVTHLEPTPAREVGSSGESYASQASYGLLLCRNPYGLLILDRAEPRPDGILEIPYWSLDDQKLYTVLTTGQSYTAVIDGYTETYRNGLCNQVITEYQPDALDFVLTGGGRKIRPNTTDILNNSESNYIGVLKMQIMPKIVLN